MSAFAYLRGHEITTDGSTIDPAYWRWADSGVPVRSDDRPCVRCGKMPTGEGHDACLGTVPGAIAACCGHGISEPYVLYPEEVDPPSDCASCDPEVNGECEHDGEPDHCPVAHPEAAEGSEVIIATPSFEARYDIPVCDCCDRPGQPPVADIESFEWECDCACHFTTTEENDNAK